MVFVKSVGGLLDLVSHSISQISLEVDQLLLFEHLLHLSPHDVLEMAVLAEDVYQALLASVCNLLRSKREIRVIQQIHKLGIDSNTQEVGTIIINLDQLVLLTASLRDLVRLA